MKKTIARLTLLLVGLFFFSFILVQSLIWQAAKASQAADTQVDYVIVLGAGLWSDEPSPTLTRRLETAYRYLVNNPQAKAVVTGGLGEGRNITEGEAMKRYLVAKGIAADRIIMEEQATNTKENIQFSKKLLEVLTQDFDGQVLIVTSDFHLYRAKFLAKRNGLEPIGLAAETPDSVKYFYHFREYFAIFKTLALDRN